MMAIISPDYAIDGAAVRLAAFTSSSASTTSIVAGDTDAVIHIKNTKTVGTFPNIPYPYDTIGGSTCKDMLLLGVPCHRKH
jgi:hypothetical protein